MIRVSSYKGAAARAYLGKYMGLAFPRAQNKHRVTQSHFLTWTPFLVHILAPSNNKPPFTSKTYLPFLLYPLPTPVFSSMTTQGAVLRPETVSFILAHKGFKESFKIGCVA